jgi:hypothetical protein
MPSCVEAVEAAPSIARFSVVSQRMWRQSSVLCSVAEAAITCSVPEAASTRLTNVRFADVYNLNLACQDF